MFRKSSATLLILAALQASVWAHAQATPEPARAIAAASSPLAAQLLELRSERAGLLRSIELQESEITRLRGLADRPALRAAVTERNRLRGSLRAVNTTIRLLNSIAEAGGVQSPSSSFEGAVESLREGVSRSETAFREAQQRLEQARASGSAADVAAARRQLQAAALRLQVANQAVKQLETRREQIVAVVESNASGVPRELAPERETSITPSDGGGDGAAAAEPPAVELMGLIAAGSDPVEAPVEVASAIPAVSSPAPQPISTSAPPAAPVEEPAAPVEEPAAPAEESAAAVEEPVAPVEEVIAAEEPAAPAEEPVAPAEGPSVVVEEPVAPVEQFVAAEEPAAPAEEPAAPAEEPAVVVEEPVAPVEEVVAAEEPAAPVDEPVAPAEEPAVVVEEPVASVEEVVAAEEPFVPAEEPAAPAEEPAVVVEEPVAPVEEVVAAEEPFVPAEEPAAPAEEPAVVVEEPVAPVEEVVSAEEPAAPAEEPVAPAEEPAVVVEEPVAPVEEVVAAEEPVAPAEEPVSPTDTDVDALIVDTLLEDGGTGSSESPETPAGDPLPSTEEEIADSTPLPIVEEPAPETVTDTVAETAVDSSAEPTGDTAQSQTPSGELGGTSESSPDAGSGTSQDTAIAGYAVLRWTVPVTRANGAPLAISELRGYEIYVLSESTGERTVISIDDPLREEHRLDGLPPDTWHFAVAAIDTDGNASELSAVVSKTIADTSVASTP